VHSLLASLPLKNWKRRVFGAEVDRWYRLAFNALAAITILPIFPMLATLPDRTLYMVPAPWRWLMVCGQVLAPAGLVGLFHEERRLLAEFGDAYRDYQQQVPRLILGETATRLRWARAIEITSSRCPG
jgi:hypothetical protein